MSRLIFDTCTADTRSPLPNFYFFKIRLGGVFRPVIVNILFVETYEFEPSLTKLAKHLKEEKITNQQKLMSTKMHQSNIYCDTDEGKKPKMSATTTFDVIKMSQPKWSIVCPISNNWFPNSSTIFLCLNLCA